MRYSFQRTKRANALEMDDRYIIQPSHPWWRRENWPNARPLPEGFRYTSDNNNQWLTNRELQVLISPAVAEEQTVPSRG